MATQIREVTKQAQDVKTLPHKSHIKLDQKTRSAVVELLNARLADGIDLALIIKQAHWNMRGPNFIAVHELMDQFRDDMDAGNDLIAERAAQLGGAVFGTTQTVAESTTVKPYPVNIFSVEDHLNALIDRFSTVANAIRDAIDAAEEAGDADTADIFTEVSRTLDKNLWFLESHLPVK